MTLRALILRLSGVVRWNNFLDYDVKIYGRPRLNTPVYSRWHKWREECNNLTYKTKMTGKDLKQIRKELDMTQQEIAVAIGCDKSTVWRLEKDNAEIRPVYEREITRLKEKKTA